MSEYTIVSDVPALTESLKRQHEEADQRVSDSIEAREEAKDRLRRKVAFEIMQMEVFRDGPWRADCQYKPDSVYGRLYHESRDAQRQMSQKMRSAGLAPMDRWRLSLEEDMYGGLELVHDDGRIWLPFRSVSGLSLLVEELSLRNVKMPDLTPQRDEALERVHEIERYMERLEEA